MNLAYKLLGDKFANFVKERISARHEKVAEKGDLNIIMDSEIFAAFQGSQQISCKYSILFIFIIFHHHHFLSIYRT